jgi:hypothetical protein
MAASSGRYDGPRRGGVPIKTGSDVAVTIQQLTQALDERDEELRKERHRYNSLDGNLRKTRNDNKWLSDKIQKLNISHDAMLKRYTEIMEEAVIPYARSKGLRLNETTGELTDDVLGPLFQDAMQAETLQDKVRSLQKQCLHFQGQDKAMRKEIQNQKGQNQILSGQIQGLQKDALEKVEKVRVISDSQFKRDFQILASSIKTLSRLIRFTEQDSVQDGLHALGFLSNVPIYHCMGRARKKTFVEAWIWAVLAEFVFRYPFTAFGEHNKEVSGVWTHLFGQEHHHGWPTPSTPCENWRRTTAEHLHETVGRAIDAKEDMEPARKRMKSSVIDPREQTENIIEAYLESVFPETDFSQVRTIVDKAYALAIQMSLQRCRLQVTYPTTGSKFVDGEMASVPDRDGEDIEGGTVAFVVNPGLTKWGDARGLHLDQRNDIVPSLVQLEATHTKQEPE